MFCYQRTKCHEQILYALKALKIIISVSTITDTPFVNENSKKY